MKTKKSLRVNLEKKRNTFFLMGLTIALGVSLMAFEWKSDKQQLMEFESGWAMDEVEMMPITRPPEPPKPKIVKPQAVTQFTAVEDEIEVEEIDWAELEEIGEAILEIDLPDEVEDLGTIDWVLIEDKPVFEGGEKALMRFLSKNTVYPQISKENEMEGVVFVQFVIGKDGSVKESKVLRGVDPYIDKEALRVVNLLPDWEAGKQRGKAVEVRYVLPFKFKLHN